VFYDEYDVFCDEYDVFYDVFLWCCDGFMIFYDVMMCFMMNMMCFIVLSDSFKINGVSYCVIERTYWHTARAQAAALGIKNHINIDDEHKYSKVHALQ